MVTYVAWLIAALPLLAFLLTLIMGKRGPLQGAAIGIAAIIASLLLSLAVLGETIAARSVYNRELDWIVIGATHIRSGWMVDPLTAVMLVVVSLVASMVQIYSVGYMQGDRRFPLYYAYLSLFTAAMLGLVLANNLVELYACWEVMGLTSYLLIGFWFEKPEAMRAAKKAFIVTRVGDVAFFFGIAWLIAQTGTADFSRLVLGESGQGPIAPGPALVAAGGTAALAWIALLLFGGAIGKSAQFPLHVWLPDAMEGPTPVSALIHAATMVAAGVYLVARMYPVFLTESTLSLLGLTMTPLAVVAWIGVITALLASLIALSQPDIKRILAYSTISQLGYMMIGLGLGSLVAGTFHLMTHAFFKALLFLGAGSVIHGAGTQVIWRMGGLRNRMPATYAAFLVGYLALAGIFPFAGFWSKDAILDAAWLHPDPVFGKVVFCLGLLGAFMTAFYMTRLMQVVFTGEWRGGEGLHEPHESPRVMLLPLVVLAALAVVSGWVGTPFANLYAAFVRTESDLAGHTAGHGPNGIVMAASLSAALAGIGLGRALYPNGAFALPHLRNSGAATALYTLSRNGFYFDEFYRALFVSNLFRVTRLCDWVDRHVIDGLVNAVGWVTVRVAKVYRLFDVYVVDGLVNLCGWVPKTAGTLLRSVQSGQVHNYILAIFLGAIVIVWWFFQGR
jgi:NADH-quinone oxidoreductase subunit L